MPAPNTRRWRQFERDVANYLGDAIGLRVETARNVSGGRMIGSDLVSYDTDGNLYHHVNGWSIEAKASTNPDKPTPWLRQAEEDADGRPYVVVAKQMYKPLDYAVCYGRHLAVMGLEGKLNSYWKMSLNLFAEQLVLYAGDVVSPEDDEDD